MGSIKDSADLIKDSTEDLIKDSTEDSIKDSTTDSTAEASGDLEVAKNSSDSFNCFFL